LPSAAFEDAAQLLPRTRYLQDVCAQPDALRGVVSAYGSGGGVFAAWRRDWVAAGKPLLVLTGMGASLFAAQVAATHLTQSGVFALAVPTSTLLSDLWPGLPENAFTVIVSQSGESVEVKELLGRLYRRPVLAVTNFQDSTLATAVDRAALMRVAPDLSVAVKTYTGTIALLLLLAAELVSGDRRPIAEELSRAASLIEEWLPRWEAQVKEIAGHLGRPHFTNLLGNGVGEATAVEAALLFKEGAKLASEGMAGAQFRHGSVEVVDHDHVTVYFIPGGDGAERQLAVSGAQELVGLGGRVITIGPGEWSGEARPFAHIAVPPMAYPAGTITEIVPVQFLAAYLARLGGFETGAFRNTGPVITARPGEAQ